AHHPHLHSFPTRRSSDLWSRGFRPGGINRQPNTLPYGADFLTNYEAGWKTTFLGSRLRWNGAIYHQVWKGFQFSFLGVNSLTQRSEEHTSELQSRGHLVC